MIDWLHGMSIKVWIALGIVVLGGILSIGLIFLAMNAPEPYPLAQSDTIASWSFKGALADRGANETATKSEIVRLKQMLGKGTNDYELLVGTASQFILLGDGKSAYRYLSKAIETDPEKGLAYFNMGHLMEQLGALATAKSAY